MLTEELSNLKSLDEFMVLDVVPLSLGVEIDGKNSTVMIPRNTTIPTKKTRTFSTSEGNQSVMRIQLFEGENEKVSGNYPLGQLIVVDIAPKPRGESKIEVTLDIDANSSLALSIVDTSTGKKQPIRVDVGSLPPSEIERMSKNVRTNSVVESKAKLENYAHSVRSSAAKRIAELKQSIEDIQAVEDKATETLRWLDSNHLTKKEEFDVKRRKLEAEVNPITRNDG
ncbi:hypothetical protein PC129_g9245 [Phytophthora cactorum]|nr:hypothetical protein Pcac1_g805 [Phytophthora cactorum]KAG2824121.1 hypothetical protein PC111_g9960 [Phytophthora cactorum]KAG2830320.1 hypothetical protein PC112_g7740 [Phytophthora cactorum]KAG2857798.1 hypothetical protein PC113_g10364 [Phytophthora cactorum]KAG2918012.1 hypothetical protein PC115_g10584 [Phytophthora cactorum]